MALYLYRLFFLLIKPSGPAVAARHILRFCYIKGALFLLFSSVSYGLVATISAAAHLIEKDVDDEDDVAVLRFRAVLFGKEGR